ncbi:hypothetical protein [Pseudorhodoplanes sp.]|uniref:hypothetical protein n=1 Tax=Pseudorhodoplanes sp. TaxID=1934341 RepID=UPI0039193C3A
MTAVSDQDAPAPAKKRSPAPSAILWAGTLLTGFVIFWGAYGTWVGTLGIPLELRPGGVTLDGALEKVRPWAPWWIMPSITALVGMLFWRWIAQRHETVSFLGAALAYVLTLAASFMVGNFCLQLGSIAQYQPQPPLWKITGILPLIFLEGLSFIAINFVYHGPVAVPLYAMTGLIVAISIRVALHFSR